MAATGSQPRVEAGPAWGGFPTTTCPLPAAPTADPTAPLGAETHTRAPPATLVHTVPHGTRPTTHTQTHTPYHTHSHRWALTLIRQGCHGEHSLVPMATPGWRQGEEMQTDSKYRTHLPHLSPQGEGSVEGARRWGRGAGWAEGARKQRCWTPSGEALRPGTREPSPPRGPSAPSIPGPLAAVPTAQPGPSRREPAQQ